MSVIESIRSFFAQCPYLGQGKLDVNYLGTEPTEYAVESKEEALTLRRYQDGGELRQLAFTLSSRERIGRAVRDQEECAERYERIADWVEEKNRAGVLPALDGGRSAQEISVLSSPIVVDTTGDAAKYQLRCRLIYYQGGFDHGE